MKISLIPASVQAAFLCLWISSANAHDFWIEAHPFNPSAPQAVDITLNVGNQLVGNTMPNIAEWYDDFSYVFKGKHREVSGQTGDDPAGRIEAKAPGLYLVGHQNLPDYVELDADRFQKYLSEEGLEKVIEHRKATGTSDQPGREEYQRCAKSLVKVGKTIPSLAELQTRLDYRLEIIPLNSPYTADKLQVKVLFDQQPVQGLLVSAFSKQAPERISKSRTDEQGLAEIQVGTPGQWIVKSVHIQASPKSHVDWISFWGSLTFERQ